MKRFFGSIFGKLFIWLLITVLVGIGVYEYWYYEQPKFHDVTMELGEDLPDISAFLTEHAKPDRVNMVTAKEAIDLGLVGTQDIVFAQGRKEETVKLTIEDTTAPKVVFKDVYAITGDEILPENFIESMEDLSPITVEFSEPFSGGEGYSNVVAHLTVKDSYGNETRGEANVYYVWMYKKYTLELGTMLTKEDILIDPVKDADLVDQLKLDEINASPVGTYTIVSTDGDQTCECVVTVEDTTPPELEVKNAKIYVGDTIAKRDFVVSVKDISGEVETNLLTTPDNSKAGKQKIQVEAKDRYGNATVKEATLEVITDTVAPKFSGLGELKVEKHSSPNYSSGVTCKDDRDGQVEFTFDPSKVDTSKAGTYYVIYTAQDKAGNKASSKRKVTVNHDKEDTDALVKQIASGLSKDPEKIRDYVRTNVKYNTNYGGSDPIWYGFKNKYGNCYVHAKCFKALLDEKGISCQIIHTTDKTHYWLIVKINGQWKHMDATPSRLHGKYSIMNDEQRLSTLSGRDWDHDKWPACN